MAEQEIPPKKVYEAPTVKDLGDMFELTQQNMAPGHAKHGEKNDGGGLPRTKL